MVGVMTGQLVRLPFVRILPTGAGQAFPERRIQMPSQQIDRFDDDLGRHWIWNQHAANLYGIPVGKIRRGQVKRCPELGRRLQSRFRRTGRPHATKPRRYALEDEIPELAQRLLCGATGRTVHGEIIPLEEGLVVAGLGRTLMLRLIRDGEVWAEKRVALMSDGLRRRKIWHVRRSEMVTVRARDQADPKLPEFSSARQARDRWGVGHATLQYALRRHYFAATDVRSIRRPSGKRGRWKFIRYYRNTKIEGLIAKRGALTVVDRACDFLRQRLPATFRNLVAEGPARGFTVWTLRLAAKRLGVHKRQPWWRAPCYWYFPGQAVPTAPTTGAVATDGQATAPDQTAESMGPILRGIRDRRAATARKITTQVVNTARTTTEIALQRGRRKTEQVKAIGSFVYESLKQAKADGTKRNVIARRVREQFGREKFTPTMVTDYARRHAMAATPKLPWPPEKIGSQNATPGMRENAGKNGGRKIP
jgi:hypothetical protein